MSPKQHRRRASEEPGNVRAEQTVPRLFSVDCSGDRLAAVPEDPHETILSTTSCCPILRVGIDRRLGVGVDYARRAVRFRRRPSPSALVKTLLAPDPAREAERVPVVRRTAENLA